MNKFLSVLLAVLMVFGLLPFGVLNHRTAEAAYSTGTFEQVTSLSDLEAGAYYVLHGINGTNTGAMKATVSSGYLGADASVVPSDGYIVNPSADVVWKLGGSQGAWTLYNENADAYAEIVSDNTAGFKLNQSATTSYTVTLSETKGFLFCSNHASAAGRGITIYKTDFRAYKESSMKTLHLYKMQTGNVCAHTNTRTETTPATCTETGSIETICLDCGLTIATETIPALGHNVSNGVCTVCGVQVKVYQLVKDVSALTAGDEILFVATSRSAACGAYNGTYLTAITVPIANEQVLITSDHAVVPFTVGGDASAFTFTGADGTLGWSDGNSVAFDGTNTNWTVTIDADGTAIVNNMGDTTRNLRYNATNPRFACYTSAQTAIQIYENVAGGSDATGAPVVTATPGPDSTPTPTSEPTATPVPLPEVAVVTCDQEFMQEVGAAITLTCATEGAAIYWRTASETEYSIYTAPLTFDAKNEGVTIYAYAEVVAYGIPVRSEETSFSFYFSSDGSVPIATARKTTAGETVQVNGSVTWIEMGDEVTTFTMQDGTAGIVCIMRNSNAVHLELGDVVTVSGVLAEETGTIRLNDAEVLSRTSGKMPAPIAADVADLVNAETAEALESMYVRIDNAWTPHVAEGMVAVADNTAAIYIYQFKDVDRLKKNGQVSVCAVLQQEASNTELTNGYYLRIQDEDSITIEGAPKAHDKDASLAAWCYGGGGDTAYLHADGGQYDWTSIATVIGGSSQKWATTKSSMSVTGWTRTDKRIEFALPTTDYKNLTLTADIRCSASGPSHFKIQYSLDGNTFHDFDNNTFTVIYYGGNDVLITLLNDFELPSDCNDRDMVYFRFMLVDQLSASAGKIAGNSGINITNVYFEGEPILGASSISATPVSGTVALNGTVALKEANSAAIEYRFYDEPEYNTNTINHSIPFVSYSEALTLTELPCVLQARKVGDNRVFTFRYEQGKVSSLIATSYGGSFAAGREFALSTLTEGATITYDITYAAGTENETVLTAQTYTEPLVFASEQFPVTITAVASCPGLIDSDTLTVSLTEKMVGGEGLYFGQMHAHTSLSDGAGTITEAFDYAKNTAKNLDFIVITDHSNYFDDKSTFGTMDGSVRGNGRWDEGKAAAAAVTDETFVGAYGYEMTWSGQYGHINTYATEGFVSRNNPVYTVRGGAGLVAYYDLIIQYPQSISQFNHPGDTFGDFEDFAYYIEAYDEVINMVEVGNGEGKVGSSMYWPSYEYYTRALDKGWHLAPTNNQDNHQGNWGDSNTCRDVIWTNDFTENGLYQSMRERRMYATEDNNLEVIYHLNSEPFGSILETKPDKVNIEVSVYDPDAADKTFTLSVIVDNGKVAYKESAVLAGEAKTFQITLEPEYAYYYIRIDQADGNIAVTSPVWIDEVTKAGVSSVEIDAEIPTMGEEMTVTANVFNNESEEMQLLNAVYTLTVGEEVTVLAEKEASELRVDTIAAQGEGRDTLAFTPTKTGEQTLTVTFTAKIGEQELILSGSIDLTVYRDTSVMHVAIDGSHNNEYVTGNYAGKYEGLSNVVSEFNGILHVISYGITDDVLADMDLLILSTPYAAANDNGGKLYTEEELNAIRNFADNGGTILVCGRSDYQDTDPSSASVINSILEAIGTDTRLNSDTVYNGSSHSFKVYESGFNTSNPYTAGLMVAETKTMAFYSTASIAMGEAAEAIASLNDSVLMSSEPLSGGGDLILAGMPIYNSYQLAADDTQSMNYYVIANIIRRAVPINTVAEARAAGEGEFFVIEGVLTTNASGYSQATAFFDSVYVEDATGGINIFPVAETYQIGQQVWISGVTGSYQGEYQLKDAKLYVSSNTIAVPEPLKVSTQDSMAEQTNGKLVTVEGFVTRFSYKGDLIEYIYVNDGTGEARIFFDGYITSDRAFDESWIKVGSYIQATGIASLGMHPDKQGVEQILPRIRVRDRAEIIELEAPALLGDVNLDGMVNASDASELLRAIVSVTELTGQQLLNADVNQDGKVDASDASVILRILVGLA